MEVIEIDDKYLAIRSELSSHSSNVTKLAKKTQIFTDLMWKLMCNPANFSDISVSALITAVLCACVCASIGCKIIKLLTIIYDDFGGSVTYIKKKEPLNAHKPR